MKHKLTLQLDSELIRQVKSLAQERQMSVSDLVGEYINSFSNGQTMTSQKSSLPPLTKSMIGSLKPQSDDAHYMAHLERKHA